MRIFFVLKFFHKSSQYAKTKRMAAIIIALAIEIIIVLAFAPIRIKLRGYFSLDRQNGGIDLKIFALTVIRSRLDKEKGKMCLKLNDKPINFQNVKVKQGVGKQLKNALNQVMSGNLRLKSNVLAVFGDTESKNSAMILGIVESFLHILKSKGKIYADFERQRADVEFSLRVDLSIVQALEMAV